MAPYIITISFYGLLPSWHYNMTVGILAGNGIICFIAAGLIRLYMPGDKLFRM